MSDVLGHVGIISKEAPSRVAHKLLSEGYSPQPGVDI